MDDATGGERIRRYLKKAIFASALLLISPLVLIAWIEKRVSSSELIFIGLGQFLALFPGMIGIFVRAAYYFALLDRCSWEIHVGFGSYFPIAPPSWVQTWLWADTVLLAPLPSARG